MAAVLIVRPWGLLGAAEDAGPSREADRDVAGSRSVIRPCRALPCVLSSPRFFVPALGSRFYTFLANDVVIWALFATSLNLLVGYTGLVSFGHAAYFGIGAYTDRHPHEEARGDVPARLPGRRRSSPAPSPPVFGFFCVRLTRIYFAMLTLAFAQIVWAICFKWNEVTGGEQGMPEIPYPTSAGWSASRLGVPLVGGCRTSEYFYFLTLVLVAGSAVGAPPRSWARPSGACSRPSARIPSAPSSSGSTCAATSWPPSCSRAPSPASPADCSASSTGASSPTSPTGPSPPRC